MTPETIALLASISFALFAVYGWLGLRTSTPLTGTIVSLAARTVTLGAALALSGGVPGYQPAAMKVFVFLGALQSAISLLTFIGLQKIDTSRSQPLRNSYPLWSTLIAILVLHEEASLAVLSRTLLVVAGVVLISWKPETVTPSHRAWHVVYSLGAGFLAGLAFPLRRYGLTITNEPIFFSFVIAVVSLAGSIPYILSFGPGTRLEPQGSHAFFYIGFLRSDGRSADARRADHGQGRDRLADRRHHAALQPDDFLDFSARQGKRHELDDHRHRRGSRGHGRDRAGKVAMADRKGLTARRANA